MKRKGDRLFVFVIALAVSFGVAFIGSLFVQQQIGSEWYESIKPSLAPPDPTFYVVWNLLFFLIALAMTFSWIFAHTSKQKQKIIWAYGISFAFNILWSFFYFYLQSPFLALIDILALTASIIVVMKVNWQISRISSWLVLPYFAWVCFAAVLNLLSI